MSSSWPGLLDARPRGTHMSEGVSGVGVVVMRPLESQAGAGWTAEMQCSLLRGDQGGIHLRKWVSVPGSSNHGNDSV